MCPHTETRSAAFGKFCLKTDKHGTLGKGNLFGLWQEDAWLTDLCPLVVDVDGIAPLSCYVLQTFHSQEEAGK